MNEEELRRNPRLGCYVVQNLNRESRLLLGEAEFDGVGIYVSINYLTRPVKVLREVGRVLKVSAHSLFPPSIVAFPIRQSPSGTT
jgi:ubiquinone/menaquinone biosynthesis C-methylase UbiE